MNKLHEFRIQLFANEKNKANFLSRSARHGWKLVGEVALGNAILAAISRPKQGKEKIRRRGPHVRSPFATPSDLMPLRVITDRLKDTALVHEVSPAPTPDTVVLETPAPQPDTAQAINSMTRLELIELCAGLEWRVADWEEKAQHRGRTLPELSREVYEDQQRLQATQQRLKRVQEEYNDARDRGLVGTRMLKLARKRITELPE